jgi:hypothetical protein
MVEWAEFWLSDMDSNHDKGLQRALCYHYTIGQTDTKIPFPAPVAKKNSHPGNVEAHGTIPELGY